MFRTVALSPDPEHTDGGRGWLGRVGGGCDYPFLQKFVVGALTDTTLRTSRATYRLRVLVT